MHIQKYSSLLWFFCCTDCLSGLRPDSLQIKSMLGLFLSVHTIKHSSNQQLSEPLVWSLSDFFFFLLVYLSQLSATYLSSGINTPHLPSAGCSLHHHLLLLSFRFVLLPRSPCVVSKWDDDDDDDGQNAGSVMNPAHLPCASSDSRDLITG